MLGPRARSKRGLVAGVMAAGLFLVVACSFTAEIVRNTPTPSPGSVITIEVTATAVPATLAVRPGGASAPTATVLSGGDGAPAGADPTATPESGAAVVTVPIATPGPSPTPNPTATPRPAATPVTIAAPDAMFSVDVSEGQAPLQVTFSNESTGEITGYEWDLGGGVTSDLESPIHEFTVAGSHTVTLTATGPGGSDTFALVGVISVGAGPAASIEIASSAPDGPAGDTLQFFAAVADEFGNEVDGPVVWAVDEAAGTISETGVFTASTVSGSYLEAVLASASSTVAVIATADVIVLPGPLHEVTLTPNLLEVPINSFKRFSLVATDEFGNEVVDFISSWSIDAEAGSIDGGEYVTGRLAGTFLEAVQVNVVQGATRLTATADIVIEPGAPALIVVEPNSVDLDRFGSQQFTASVTDQSGNELPGIELLWESSGGTITADGFFNANDEPGRHEIRAVAFTREEIAGVAIADVPSIDWDFSRGTHGWVPGTNNAIANFIVTTEGIDFDSIGTQAILIGPHFDDQSESDLLIKIRMRTAAGTHGYFNLPAGALGVEVTLIPDGQWHVYEWDASSPAGSAQLRFDPAFSAGHVTIASIKLIPNPFHLTSM